MLREEYERIIYESNRRLSFLSDVVEFANRHKRHEDLKGLQIFLIREVRRVRSSLWDLRESADAEEIKKAIDALELSELHIRKKDYHSAWSGVNASYGFLSRITINLFDVKKELKYMEHEILIRGMVIGGIGGFLLGFMIYVLSLLVYYLG